MPLTFPGPSDRTDQYALHVVTQLGELGAASGYMVSVGELDDGRLIVALSGEQAVAEALLEDRLRAVPAPYPGFRRSVIEGHISFNRNMLNPFAGRAHGFQYGGPRNCAEPKIIEMTAVLGQRLEAMTTVWYGATNNRAGRQGYIRYRDGRAPKGGVAHGVLNFAVPCEICRANEARLMLYLQQGFPARKKPKFGSFESPF